MILFRADGNVQIGSGHVMRCLSIADEFRRKQKESLFVLADNTFQTLIEGRGYGVHILGSDYRNFDGELEQMKKATDRYHPEMVIVDSYFVSKEYLRALKEIARLIYIDDLATFAYPVDVLINYNAYAPDIDYKRLYRKANIAMPVTILGIEYVPLRDMFRNVPVREQKPTVQDILISTGGADPIHLALKLVRHIVQNTYPQTYHFLIGAMNPDYEQILNVAAGHENIRIHYQVKDMKSLISSCDLVVSAAGSTMYEISACGVPMITYILADNQIPGARAFEKLGLAIFCGDLRANACAEIQIMKAIDLLANNYALRKKIGEKMQRMVDGYGADRLIRVIN